MLLLQASTKKTSFIFSHLTTACRIMISCSSPCLLRKSGSLLNVQLSKFCIHYSFLGAPECQKSWKGQFLCEHSAKSQVISKFLFGVFNSLRNEQKQFNLRYHSSKMRVSIQGVKSFWGDRVVFPRLETGDTDRWRINLSAEKQCNPPKVI